MIFDVKLDEQVKIAEPVSLCKQKQERIYKHEDAFCTPTTI